MIKALLLDIDGTVRKHDTAIPGAIDFVNRLHLPYVFLSNTPDRIGATVAQELRNIGFHCRDDQVVTCLEATVSSLKPATVFYIGSAVVGQLLSQAGFEITEENPKYVIVAYDTDCTDRKIEKASRLIRNGSMFVGTNPDKVCFTARGVSPGTGALLAAVQAATGKQPLIIGKPNRSIVDVALSQLKVPRAEVLLIGDYLEIDVQAGLNAGVKTGLVLTGASSKEDLRESPIRPDWIFEDFSEINALLSNQEI